MFWNHKYFDSRINFLLIFVSEIWVPSRDEQNGSFLRTVQIRSLTRKNQFFFLAHQLFWIIFKTPWKKKKKKKKKMK